jgi:hypothetical protein
VARKPKGSIIQPLPSWNLRRMYGTAFGIGTVPLGALIGSGVFNAQTRGEWLVIWDVQVFATGSFAAAGAVVDINIMTGTQSANTGYQKQPANPLISANTTIPSFGWGFKDSATNEAGLNFLSLQIPVNGYQWVHDWPLCAIQPGDSVVAYSDSNAYQNWGATWIFEVVPGGI